MQQNLLKSENQPTKIEAFDHEHLRVQWQDLTSYKLSYKELRFQCPCASCVDEHTGKRTIKIEQVSPTIKPKNIELIGRYAFQFFWNDSHSTGMYHFDKLLNLCQTKGTAIQN